MIRLLIFIAAATLASCDLYESVEVEVIHTPRIDQEIITPNWDENEIQK